MVLRLLGDARSRSAARRPVRRVFGEYMRAGYPNWATKYLLDALMLQERLGERRATIDCNPGVCR